MITRRTARKELHFSLGVYPQTPGIYRIGARMVEVQSEHWSGG